jgi:hypothetical protein
MQIIVKSSKRPGDSYRRKEGVTCNSFSELMNEMTRLWNIAKLEKTDEHITLQVRQETYAEPKRIAYDVYAMHREKPERIFAEDMDELYGKAEALGIRPDRIRLIEPVERELVER